MTGREFKVGDRIVYVGPGNSKDWKRLVGATGVVANVWETEDEGVGSVVTCVAWTPDDPTMASRAADGIACNWMSRGSEVLPCVHAYVIDWRRSSVS